VHIHILPRQRTDFGGDNDKIYPAIEATERGLVSELEGKDGRPSEGLKVPKDEDRKPRSLEVMEEEARWLSGLFEDQTTS
jgi:bis(5'-adenosyl)-triphosphatase